MSALTDLARQLEDSGFATALRESIVVFPVVEGLHLLGLALSVGLICLIDLRLVGFFLRRVPVDDVLRPLRPWMLAGFAITFATGFLLFAAAASSLLTSALFLAKLGFIALAGLNALAFERWPGRQPQSTAGGSWPRARMAGWTSLLFWTAVTVCGRLIPYYTK